MRSFWEGATWRPIDGAAGRNVLIRGGREELLPGKIALRLSPGDRLRIETPGGGAYGAAVSDSGH